MYVQKVRKRFKYLALVRSRLNIPHNRTKPLCSHATHLRHYLPLSNGQSPPGPALPFLCVHTYDRHGPTTSYTCGSVRTKSYLSSMALHKDNQRSTQYRTCISYRLRVILSCVAPPPRPRSRAASIRGYFTYYAWSRISGPHHSQEFQ